jgi:SAM-dependent methyltransferase
MTESANVRPSVSPRRTAAGKRRPFAATPSHYDHVAHGYDLVARTYDLVEGRNAISERVRRTTLQAALRAFRVGDRVLELGCGTGRDAVDLARAGIQVVATDISAEMISITRARASREGVEDLVDARVLSAAEAVRAGGPYDGVYSNGAVLNLEPNLPEVVAGLKDSLRQGAHAVLTAANRLSLFELAVYPLGLRPRKAFRKLGTSVPIPISREGIGKGYVVPTRFFTPKEFLWTFNGGFEVVSLRGLQSITPPWNLVDMSTRFRTVVAPLERIEDRIGTWRPLRTLGAIYLVVMRRRDR